jgi:hypothetical protein
MDAVADKTSERNLQRKPQKNNHEDKFLLHWALPSAPRQIGLWTESAVGEFILRDVPTKL